MVESVGEDGEGKEWEAGMGSWFGKQLRYQTVDGNHVLGKEDRQWDNT